MNAPYQLQTCVPGNYAGSKWKGVNPRLQFIDHELHSTTQQDSRRREANEINKPRSSVAGGAQNEIRERSGRFQSSQTRAILPDPASTALTWLLKGSVLPWRHLRSGVILKERPIEPCVMWLLVCGPKNCCAGLGRAYFREVPLTDPGLCMG